MRGKRRGREVKVGEDRRRMNKGKWGGEEEKEGGEDEKRKERGDEKKRRLLKGSWLYNHR